MHLPDELQERLLRIARRALVATTSRAAPPAPEFRDGDPVAGAFVTLHVHDALRGCTGTLAPARPLPAVITDLTISSATADPRFPPLTYPELADTRIEVSVVTPPVPAHPEEVIVGRHGLVISGGFRCGVLLPRVASERGMSREEFLDAACRKAGLRAGAWREGGLDVATFEAIAFRESSGSASTGGSAFAPGRAAPLD